MNENEPISVSGPQEADQYDTTERMAGLSEKDYKGGATPLDHRGEPEEAFEIDPNNPTVRTKISPKRATELHLSGKGHLVKKSWQLDSEEYDRIESS